MLLWKRYGNNKMAAICYYGNVMTTTRWRLYVILHLQQYSRRLNLFFVQSREQVVVRQGQIWRMGWVIKTLESQVGQFLLGCKCPVKRGIVVQGQNHLGELPAAFFLPNILQLHQQRCVTLSVDSLVLGKIINEEDAVLAQKIEARNFPADFCTRILM